MVIEFFSKKQHKVMGAVINVWLPHAQAWMSTFIYTCPYALLHACGHTHASTSRHAHMYVPVHKRLVNLSSVGSWYAILFWQEEVKTWASRTLLDYAQRAYVSFLVTVTKFLTKADYRGFILLQLFDAVAYCQWWHEHGTRNHVSRCSTNCRFWTLRQPVTLYL